MTHLPPQPPEDPPVVRHGAGVPIPPQAPKRGTPPWVWVLVTVLAVCVVIPAIVSTIKAVGGKGSQAADQPTAGKDAAVVPQQLSPADQLTKAITDKLGKPNRDGATMPIISIRPDQPGAPIDVEWALNDNLTEGLIRTGARADVVDIIRVVKAKATWPYRALRLKATFSMKDKFGNASETEVLNLTYNSETVQKINPDGVELDRVLDLADSGTVHPAFR